MAFQWYTRDLDKGFPGMIADATDKIIDSYAVEEETGLEPGVAVIQGTAENQVKKYAGTGTVIGVTMHQHKEPTEPYYPQYHTVPVVTMGDIYVQVGEDVATGDSACLMASTYAWGKTGTAVSNAYYYKGADKDGLAIVRLRTPMIGSNNSIVGSAIVGSAKVE